MEAKQQFYTHFNNSVALLRGQIEQLPSISTVAGERQEAIDHTLAAISKLQNEVADVSDETPAYDRRQYSQSIKSLQDQLNETTVSLAPKSRFRFKRVTKHIDMGKPENDPRLHTEVLNRSPNNQTLAESPSMESTDSGSKDYNKELSQTSGSPSSVRRPSFSRAKQIGIVDQRLLHIIVPGSAAQATAAGSLNDLSDCIVDLTVPTRNRPFPGLALRDIKKCVIVAGRVAGPVHITGVSDSVLVLASHQARIHECRNVDIYLHCTSHPIIEDCSGMRFAPLPSFYTTEDDNQETNQWSEVDDFKWLKAGHSPNWTTLSEAQRFGSDIWKHVADGDAVGCMADQLKKFGIPR